VAVNDGIAEYNLLTTDKYSTEGVTRQRRQWNELWCKYVNRSHSVDFRRRV